jgi:hypothetical protein
VESHDHFAAQNRAFMQYACQTIVNPLTSTHQHSTQAQSAAKKKAAADKGLREAGSEGRAEGKLPPEKERFVETQIVGLSESDCASHICKGTPALSHLSFG